MYSLIGNEGTMILSYSEWRQKNKTKLKTISRKDKARELKILYCEYVRLLLTQS